MGASFLRAAFGFMPFEVQRRNIIVEQPAAGSTARTLAANQLEEYLYFRIFRVASGIIGVLDAL